MFRIDENKAIEAAYKMGFDAGRESVEIKWQPIETAPRDGTFFLAWFDKQEHHFLLWWFDGAWRFKGGTIEPSVCFTHWMALPDLPKGDE